jgi:hypothetical protein
MADLCWTGYVGDQPCNAIGKSCKDCRCERLCRCMLVTGLQQGVALHLGCFNEALIRTIRTSMVLATACNCASCSKPSLNGLRTTLQCFPYLAYMLAGVPRHVNTMEVGNTPLSIHMQSHTQNLQPVPTLDLVDPHHHTQQPDKSQLLNRNNSCQCQRPPLLTMICIAA